MTQLEGRCRDGTTEVMRSCENPGVEVARVTSLMGFGKEHNKQNIKYFKYDICIYVILYTYYEYVQRNFSISLFKQVWIFVCVCVTLFHVIFKRMSYTVYNLVLQKIQCYCGHLEQLKSNSMSQKGRALAFMLTHDMWQYASKPEGTTLAK